MRLSKPRTIIVFVLTLIAVGAGIAVYTHTESKPQDHLCWDVPESGTRPEKYVVIVDGGSPIETKIECVRIPLGLKPGEHTAVVRAVDAFGQTSPPASLKFVEP